MHERVRQDVAHTIGSLYSRLALSGVEQPDAWLFEVCDGACRNAGRWLIEMPGGG
jgi:hypothetical protein